MSQFNPGRGLFPPRIPGRVIRKVERFPLPGGTVREMRWVQITFQAPDGTWQTEECTEVVPPLDDGIVPKDIADVLYCLSCHRLVCLSVHSFRCLACGQTFCVWCRSRVDGIPLCPKCAEKIATPVIVLKIRKLVWGE